MNWVNERYLSNFKIYYRWNKLSRLYNIFKPLSANFTKWSNTLAGFPWALQKRVVHGVVKNLPLFHPRLKSMFIRNRRQILLLHQLILSELAFIPPEIIIRPYVFSWFQGELKLICLILEKKFGDVPLFSRSWKRTSYEIFCQLKVVTIENSHLVPVFQKTFL